MSGLPALDLSSWHTMHRLTNYRRAFFIVVVTGLPEKEFLGLVKKSGAYS